MPITEPTLQQQSTALQQGWGFQQHQGDKSNQRFALCRVWRGYIMTAYRSNGSDNKIYFRFYDPYAQSGKNWLPGSPSASNLITQSPVALFYSNLTAYVFFSQNDGQPNGGRNWLAWAYAAQPALTVHGNQYWDFTSLKFNNPQSDGDANITLGPSVAPFDGNLWVVFGVPIWPLSGTGSNIYLLRAVLPTTQGLQFQEDDFNFGGLVKDSSGSQVVIICEPVLISFAGGLYCFYVNAGNLIQYVRVDSPGPVVTIGARVGASSYSAMSTDAAPGVTVDPTGTLVILCYKSKGSNSQIMCTWTADLQSWFTPQVIKGQGTSAAPTLYASNAGQVLMAFRSGSDSSMYTLNTSDYWYLPNGVNAPPPSS